MLEKLQAIKERWQTIEQKMSEPTAMNDMKQFAQLSRDYKELGKIVEAYEGWDGEQQRLNAEARAERKARQEALVAENDTAADLQHQDA